MSGTRRRLYVLAALTLMVLAVACSGGGSNPSAPASTRISPGSAYWRQAESLAELTAKSPVVVIGRVERKIGSRPEDIPGRREMQAAGTLRKGDPLTTPLSLYEVAVESYVRGSGPSSITLGQLDGAEDEAPPPEFGLRALLFLVPVPGRNEFASAFGPFGRIVETPAGLRYMGLPYPIHFLPDVDLGSLAQSVTAVAAQ